MFKRIIKRDGKIVKFDPEKITEAIAKAGLVTEEFKYDRAKTLTEKVVKRAEETIKERTPHVEQIQDIVAGTLAGMMSTGDLISEAVPRGTPMIGEEMPMAAPEMPMQGGELQ